MATRVRSYAKVNLGLAIGAPRPDGFHGLRTLYQTLALHDFVTVAARRTDGETSIRLRSNDARVPLDSRNTVWKMMVEALKAADLEAEVEVNIEKRLPIQGGMGAGSANAAAALLGLERELGLKLDETARLQAAAAVGSDVPLFLVGGSSLGFDRGQVVEAVPDIALAGETRIPCCVALPGVGVSTPLAFREWDRRYYAAREAGYDLHNVAAEDTLDLLSRTYASVFPAAPGLQDNVNSEYGASGIFPETKFRPDDLNGPEKQQGLLHEQLHGDLKPGVPGKGESGFEDDLAENTLLALVRTGIENDFETVVFAQHPFLREIKRHLMGPSGSRPSEDCLAKDNPAGDKEEAVYAALSGSGSALFGLYRTMADAERAQQRCQQHGVTAVVTKTMPRPLYWEQMFAE